MSISSGFMLATEIASLRRETMLVWWCLAVSRGKNPTEETKIDLRLCVSLRRAYLSEELPSPAGVTYVLLQFDNTCPSFTIPMPSLLALPSNPRATTMLWITLTRTKHLRIKKLILLQKNTQKSSRIWNFEKFLIKSRVISFTS